MYFHKAQQKPRLYGSFQDRQYSIWRNLEKIYGVDHKTEVLIIPGFWGLPPRDYSKYGNHGTNHGATYKDGSLDFDGSNDYVDLISTIIDPSNTDFTVSAISKIDTLNVDRNIIAYDGGSPEMYYLYYDTPDLKTYDQTSGKITLLASPSVDTWYHIVLVSQSGDITGYVNGEKKVGPQTFAFHTPSVNLLIGAGASRYHDGIIDEVRISKAARTSDQIALFYDRPWDLYRPVARVIYSIPAAGGISIPVAMQNMRGGFNPIGMRGGFINAG